MECPRCHSNKNHKYGHQRGKQRYKCNECGRQFIENKTERGYDEKTKLLCLKAMQQGNRGGSKGTGEAARSWGGSAFTRGFPPLALCRGFPHSRFAVVPPGDET
ncbi:MAG: IS1 family transposase [Moorea sp. SIO4A3]|nr:IS1 family transposase [Moorena sp. SIO4A3]